MALADLFESNFQLRNASESTTTPDDLQDIEKGLEELEEAERGGGRVGAYWQRIRAKILECSSNHEDVDAALKEWAKDGRVIVAVRATCELCGKHPIVYQFPIKNRVTQIRLKVGSECIYNYLVIPGFVSSTELKKRLMGERNRHIQVAKGLKTQKELEAFQEATELEVALTVKYGHLAVGGQDFNVQEYRDNLRSWQREMWYLDNKHPIIKTIDDALASTYRLWALIEKVAKRTTKVRVIGPLTLIKGCMQVRSDEAKLALLESAQSAIELFLKHGTPEEVTRKIMDAIEESRKTALERISAAETESLKNLDESVKRYILVLNSYGNLMKVYEGAIETVRKAVKDRFESKRANIQALKEGKLGYSSFYGNELVTVLKDPMSDSQVANRIRATVDSMTDAYCASTGYARQLLQKYLPGQSEIKDITGIKVAFYLWWDKYAPTSFYPVDSWLSGGQPAWDLILQEVDDVQFLFKKKLHQFLGERWGINVQHSFERFSADNKVDFRFCEGLVTDWEQWPKLGPTFLAKIRQNDMNNPTPVQNSAWDMLKTTLMQPVD